MRFLVNLINHKEVRKTPLVKFPDSLLEDWEEKGAKARKGSKYRAPVSSALDLPPFQKLILRKHVLTSSRKYLLGNDGTGLRLSSKSFLIGRPGYEKQLSV